MIPSGQPQQKQPLLTFPATVVKTGSANKEDEEKAEPKMQSQDRIMTKVCERPDCVCANSIYNQRKRYSGSSVVVMHRCLPLIACSTLIITTLMLIRIGIGSCFCDEQ